MKKFCFVIVWLVIGLLAIPLSSFATTGVKITGVVPGSLRQNDAKIVTIKGKGFLAGAQVDLGEGITVNTTEIISSKQIKLQVTVDLTTKTGKRTVTVTNPDGKKGVKKNAIRVKKCIKDCEVVEPFSGNPIPIHDKNSSSYRTDCTNASCHRGILKETSLDSSINTFHVLKMKLSVISGKTNDAKCLYCHKNTDMVEHSAGSLRKNVDVAICYSCHLPGGIGKEFYKE